jgi:hypothetical protein
MYEEWWFHDSWAFEPEVFEQPWWSPEFQPSARWGTGSGIFHRQLNNPAILCAGDSLGAAISFQPQPTLFRRAFFVPDHLPTQPSAELRVRHIFDDGMILYLNGLELFRFNMPGTPGSPWTTNTTATSAITQPTCATNTFTLTNLVLGTNWLAAAVFQAAQNSGDTLFGLEPDLKALVPGPLPPEPTPILAILRQDTNVVLSWSGSGYFLEAAASLSNNLSFPFGPWVEVPNMTNPYPSPVAEPFQFFRLKK